MTAVGVVCEYNPFHRGHTWHLRRTRERLSGDVTLLCVMSGDYVQRGEAAAFSKFARAEAACRCGADLVAELPLPWCLSSAEGFARGATALLHGLGAQVLSFGAETEELAALEALAECLSEAETQQAIRASLKEDASLSYARAREQLMAERLGPSAELLREPNCILAVEYLRAIREQALPMEPLAVLRRGCGHDRQEGEEGILSASAIRAKLNAAEPIAAHVPEKALTVYEREIALGRRPDAQRTETALLSRLHMLKSEDFEALPDAGEGMGRRLYRALHTETELVAVLRAASAGRYTQARLRRALYCAALGVDRTWSAQKPPYARILAMNDRGRAHLAALRETEGLPPLIKPAAVRRLPDRAQALFQLGAQAHDFYGLCSAAWRQSPPGEDWRTGPVLV